MMNNHNILTLMYFLSFVTDVLIMNLHLEMCYLLLTVQPPQAGSG